MYDSGLKFVEQKSIIYWNTYFRAMSGKAKPENDKPNKLAFYAKYGDKIERVKKDKK